MNPHLAELVRILARANVEEVRRMQEEAVKLIEACKANPNAEIAMAIFEFIDRSPDHEACFNHQIENVTGFRMPSRNCHGT